MGTLGGQGCPSELYRFRGGDSGENLTVTELFERIKAEKPPLRSQYRELVRDTGERHPSRAPSPYRTLAALWCGSLASIHAQERKPDFQKMSRPSNRTALGIEPEGWRPVLSGLHRRRRARRPTQSDATSTYPPQLEPRGCCGINSKWQTTTPSLLRPAPRSIN
jgi:hypothetical protein